MVDAGHGRSTGIDALGNKPLSYIQDAVRQFIALGWRLVISDEEDEVFAAWIFKVIKVILGKGGLFHHVIFNRYSYGVEEVGRFDISQFLKRYFGTKIVSDNHGYITDAGPCRQQVGGAKLRPGGYSDNIAHINLTNSDIIKMILVFSYILQ
jgi:hypothetical protein